MARYLVAPPTIRVAPSGGPRPNDTGFIFIIRCQYWGSDVSGGVVESTFDVPILNGDSPAQAADKIITAVVNEGTRLGFTVARNAGLLPSFQRGS